MVDLATAGLLMAGGGSLLSALLGSDAQNDANKINQQLGSEDLALRKELLTSGSVDAFGNLINAKDGSGPYKTILTGDTKALADKGLSNALSSENARGEAGSIRDSLISQFKASGSQSRAPVSLEQARGIVGADDDAIKNAILNPALADAAALDKRTYGNSSNTGNLTSRFQERVLPQIKLGGEQRAMALADSDKSRYTNETLGLGEGLNKLATGGFQPEIPGVANLNSIAQASNAIPKPTTVQPDVLGSNLSSAASGVGQLITGYANQQNNNKLTDALAKRLSGNQGSY